VVALFCGTLVGGYMDDIKERYIKMCLASGQKDYDYDELCEMSTRDLRDLADKYSPKVNRLLALNGELIYVIISKKTA
jgi:hypothetical protein